MDIYFQALMHFKIFARLRPALTVIFTTVQKFCTDEMVEVNADILD